MEYINDDGEIVFPGSEDLYFQEPSYKFFATCYGFNFAHNGLYYDDTDHNCRLATRRLTAIRMPEIPWVDNALRINQDVFIRDNSDLVKNLLYLNLGDPGWDYTMIDEAIKLKDLPHIKRALREADIIERLNNGEINLPVWLRSVTWKFKKAETAKPDKYPRNIVDLGVGASLQGAPWADCMKHYLSHTSIFYNDCDFIVTGKQIGRASCRERVCLYV